MEDRAALDDNPPVSEFLIDKHSRHTSNPLNLIPFLVEAHNSLVSAADKDRWVLFPSALYTMGAFVVCSICIII